MSIPSDSTVFSTPLPQEVPSHSTNSPSKGRTFTIVVAQTRRRGIGRNGTVPWPRLNKDMAHFVTVTKSTRDASKMNAVIMGRKTWESIPESFRPLSGRLNIIITSQPSNYKDLDQNKARAVNSLQAALDLVESDEWRNRIESVHAIGGTRVFEAALQHPQCEYLHITEVMKQFECDTFMPPLDSTLGFEIVEEGEVEMDGPNNDIPIQNLTYQRCKISKEVVSESKTVDTYEETKTAVESSKRHDEYQYLDLVRKVISEGVYKIDRTQVGTFSIFGSSLRFNLRNGVFPLLTTKRVFLKGIIEELIWFIRGSTNSKELQDKGVKIWDGNSTRDFLDRCGLTTRNVNDLGPVYGFQWRHFGANYIDSFADYKDKGVDQLSEVIHTLKNNPNSRRIIMSAWNPVDIPKMALPPCHVLSQFYVSNGELSCILYQRSCDMGLGIPFNIASYALLTYFIAKITNLRTGEFIHFMGDTHIYSNHVEALKVQLTRDPRPFPKITIRDREGINSITDFVAEDVIIEGYDPHPAIKMDMAV